MSTITQTRDALPIGAWQLDGSATLTGSARVEDVAVQDENLNAHLLSPEFFDAERTPEIRFASSEISRSDDDVFVAGDLTIKGLTAPVELRGTISDSITDAYGQQRIGLTLEGVVDRTSFGLDWNVALPSGDPALANDVTLTTELYLIKA